MASIKILEIPNGFRLSHPTGTQPSSFDVGLDEAHQLAVDLLNSTATALAARDQTQTRKEPMMWAHSPKWAVGLDPASRVTLSLTVGQWAPMNFVLDADTAKAIAEAMIKATEED
jgi:hypothetical protein